MPTIRQENSQPAFNLAEGEVLVDREQAGIELIKKPVGCRIEGTKINLQPLTVIIFARRFKTESGARHPLRCRVLPSR